MEKILGFFLLARLTGSPWIALAIVVAFAWALDRSTLRWIPGPWVAIRRVSRRRALATLLADNPHDFRSELEIGRLFLESRRWRDALPHLERAAGAYATDASVQALRAVARIGAGQLDAGVAELEKIMTANPRLRVGEPWIDAGEILLAAGDAPRAKAMIARFLEMQPSSVRGLTLLARAEAKCGDPAAARAMRAKAWREYATNPKFRQREERMWAYRANPWRPAVYGICAFMALGAVAVLLRVG